jgi:hypothetical protein
MFPEWVISRVTVGGRPSFDNRISITGEDVDDVEVVFTDRPSEIRGLVSDSTGRVISDVSVVAIPTDRRLWKDFRSTPARLMRVRSNSEGAYVLVGLPPGDYRVVAVDPEPPREWYDGELLALLEQKGQPARVVEGVKAQLDLRITRLP